MPGYTAMVCEHQEGMDRKHLFLVIMLFYAHAFRCIQIFPVLEMVTHFPADDRLARDVQVAFLSGFSLHVLLLEGRTGAQRLLATV